MSGESLEVRGEESVDVSKVFNLADIEPESRLDFLGADAMLPGHRKVKIDDAVAL